MKKYKIGFITVLALITVVVTLMGCGKAATENKLLGRWTRINIDNLDDTTRVEEWEFLGGTEMRIYFHHVSDYDTNYVSGSYFMKGYREFNVSGAAEDGWPMDANGKWRIVKLKKGSLIIVRDEGGHGLTFKEFKQI